MQKRNVNPVPKVQFVSSSYQNQWCKWIQCIPRIQRASAQQITGYSCRTESDYKLGRRLETKSVQSHIIVIAGETLPISQIEIPRMAAQKQLSQQWQSIYTRAWGSKGPRKFEWMKSYMASNKHLFMDYRSLPQDHHKGTDLTQNQGTLTLHNLL